MKLIDLSLPDADREFGSRLVTLNSGRSGIRAGMKFTVKGGCGDASLPILDFIGSDGSVDRYNEVIDQKGWQLDNFRANPVIPDCHDYSSIGKILGKAISVEVKDGQLVNRVQFCTDNPMGMLAYKMAKGGFINSQSVGFIPLEWTRGVNANEPDRTYTACELLEISMVVVPANPGATVGLALKSGAIERADLRGAAEFLKQFCGDEKPDSAGQGSAAAAGVHAAQLLQLIRGLSGILKK
jgi:HK97 family phage prohead protease